MPRTLRHLNRTPWTAAEQAIILRPGITEHQAAAALWAELGSRRSASAVGTERRRLGAASNVELSRWRRRYRSMKMEQSSPPTAVGSNAGLGFTVGQEVTVTRRIWEPATGDSPGGLLARRGEKLIVRMIYSKGQHPIHVSHEFRTDGATFCVSADELRPYATPATSLGDADLTEGRP